MGNTKRLGIWMDFTSAHLIEFLPLRVDAIVIKSNINNPTTKRKPSRNEEIEKSNQKNLLFDFYKKIENEILNYRNVILFGPTKAKTELMEILKKNQKIEAIKIELVETEKMNENQKQAFVKNYFTNKVS